MVAELIPLMGSAIPDARAFAMMESISDSSLMLYGGVNEDPLNDAFIFDCNKRQWKLVYRADPSTCEPTGALATIHAGEAFDRFIHGWQPIRRRGDTGS